MKRQCPDLGLLFSFLDHELADSRFRQIEAHVAGCHDCQERLQSLKSDRELGQAGLALLAPDQTAVPPWPVRSHRLRPAALTPLEQLLAIVKNNLRPALAILGMLLVAFIIREKITTKPDAGRFGSGPYAMDSLSVRHTPHDSSVYAQWLKSVDDTTLIKLMLKSKGDATVVHL